MYIYSKNIYFLNQIKREGYLEIKEGKIHNFSTDIDSNEFEDYSNYLIIPGFIDQHIHGWGTGSFIHNRSSKALKEMRKWLPVAGVTSFLPTTGAEPIENLKKAIHMVEQEIENGDEEGATHIASLADGTLNVVGLKDGDYILNETNPPSDKYVRIPDGTIQFRVTAGLYNTHYGFRSVPNTPKGILPATGGSGIYGFLALGAVMMSGAYVWFKKSKDQADA